VVGLPATAARDDEAQYRVCWSRFWDLSKRAGDDGAAMAV
jgi:hypothetical protein